MNKEAYYLDLTRKHETPFFLYDGNIIENQYNKIQKAFSNCSNFQTNYAIKALSNISILKLVKKLGSHVDAVSINEIKLAFLAGFTANEIHFTPNGAHFNEILEAQKLGVHITLDNIIQIEKFAKLRLNNAIAIRINPRIKAGGNKKIIVAKKNSKFGLSLNKIEQLHKLISNYNLKIDGFHIHLGSDISNLNSFLESAKVLFSVAKEFKNLKIINFGGGFKVKYSKGDKFIDIDEIGLKLTHVFNVFTKDYGANLKLVIEPGKFLVSNAGVFLTEITTIKEHTVFINSGFNHFIRPMYYNAYHQIKNISSTQTSDKEYNIVGYICEQDYFGKKRKINKPNVGNIICIENAGAYCFTMASNYNSRLKPLELLFYNDETKVIRKKETFDDLITNQVY
jgi:diaminopimelate decarboxylase